MAAEQEQGTRQETGAVDKSKKQDARPDAARSSKALSEAQTKRAKEEARQESSKAARKALELQRQSRELTSAAAGAGDPEERQKLLNDALNKSVEAESFGKTAKYLQSGAFQGLLAGGGIGTGIGTSVGTLTGALVGGLTSVIFGGLMGGMGAAIGALHGPWFKPGEALGNGIRKITGDLPGWKATDKQKYDLEKMIGDVNDQERPTDEELEAMTVGDSISSALTEEQRETLRGWTPKSPWKRKELNRKQTKRQLQQASDDEIRGKPGPDMPAHASGQNMSVGGGIRDAPSAEVNEEDSRLSKRHAEGPEDSVGRSASQQHGQVRKKKPRKLERRSARPAPTPISRSASGT